MYSGQPSYWLFTLVSYLVLGAILFVFDILIIRARKKNNVDPSTPYSSPNLPFTNSQLDTKLKVFLIVLILFYAFGLAYRLGAAEATNRASFLVNSGANESVALRVYNNRIIFVPFDRDKKTIKAGIFLLQNPSSITVKYEKVGPLTVDHQ